MSLAIVTTTRNRPESFALVEKWVGQQTIKPDAWFVVNDGNQEYKYHHDQKVILRDYVEESRTSLTENWLAVLPVLEDYEKIIVVEDDDWIHPVYLETIAGLLDKAELAGVSNDLYWLLRYRLFRRCFNCSHASLACSGFRKSFLPSFKLAVIEEMAVKSQWIDMRMWDLTVTKELVDNRAPDGRPIHLGLKGFPGPSNLGLGGLPLGSSDPRGQILLSWVGSEVYSDIWRFVEQPKTG